MYSPERSSSSLPEGRGWTRGVLVFALGGLAGGVVAGQLMRAPMPGAERQDRQLAAHADENSNGPGGSNGLTPGSSSTPAPGAASGLPSLAELAQRPLRFVTIGGGADPMSTQVQIERPTRADPFQRQRPRVH